LSFGKYDISEQTQHGDLVALFESLQLFSRIWRICGRKV